MDIVGTPPIRRDLFWTAKVAAAISWLLIPAQALGVNVAIFDWSSLRLPAILLMVAGLLVMGVAGKYLGSSTRVGLPREATQLKTSGVYRFSRNPMYFALFLVCLGSCLYAPHWVNFAATAVTIAIHHRIVRAEEKFLVVRFGPAWRDYAARVRRYV